MFIRGQHLFHFSLPKCGVYWRAAFKRGNTVFLSVFLLAKNILPPINELSLMKILLCFNVYIIPSQKKITPKATLGFELTISSKIDRWFGQVDLTTRPRNWCVMRAENIYLNCISKDREICRQLIASKVLLLLIASKSGVRPSPQFTGK